MKKICFTAWMAGFISLLVWSQAQAEEKLGRGKDRIDVPAIGDGLCLHNLFQSGMVLQRDKPIRIWGWAEPGENMTFGEKTQSSTTAADRSWKGELPALTANSEPHQLVVQGKAKTIKLQDLSTTVSVERLVRGAVPAGILGCLLPGDSARDVRHRLHLCPTYSHGDTDSVFWSG